MNGRDGRYDSGDMDDADWLLSQLGSGRRPDLEGRETPQQPPVAQPPQPAEPIAPPPGERPRRRSEESLDWFSLAETAPDEDAATRELPVVGEPFPRRDESPQPPAPPQWEQQAPAWSQPPAWNQPPAWDDRRPPQPQHDRLTSVEPPVGAPIPPAFGGPRVPPPQGPPPGPVTPPANFALTWGEQPRQQPIDSEDDLRAAFRQLSEPSGSGPVDDGPRTPAEGRGEEESPFPGFAPPPVARQSFTPVTPPRGNQVFPPARTDFDDELWSALNEESHSEEPAREQWEPYDDGRGYSAEQAYADSSGHDQGYGDHHDDRAGYDRPAYVERGQDRPGYDETGYQESGYQESGYDETGYDDRGYDREGYDRAGYDQRGYDDRGYDERGYDERGYDQRGYDERGYDQRGFEDRADEGYADGGFDERSASADPGVAGDDRDDVRWYADRANGDAARDRQGGRGPRDGQDRQGDGFDDDAGSPMARELAQTGYFWNLTPDPTAPDPRAASDDEPGPRRRGAAAPSERDVPDDRGRGAAGVAAAGAGDGRAAPEDAWGSADDDAEWHRSDDADADADAHADGSAEAQDDAFAAYLRENAMPSDDDRDHWGGQGDEWGDQRSDAWADRFGLVDDASRGTDEAQDRGDRRAEPGTDTDGLASLFGGAGFGVTAPTPLVGGAGGTRSLDEDPFGRPEADPIDRMDADPFGRPIADPFERIDADPFGRPSRDPFDGTGADPYDRDPRGFDDRGRDDRSDRSDRGAPARPAGSDDRDRDGRSPVKVLAWIAGGLAAVLLVVAGVVFGSQLLGGSGEEPVADAEVPVAEPTAMQPPGVHAWNQLYGGECLEPFGGAWAEEFTVVDCGTEHTAQLVLRGDVSTDAAAPFPGEAEIATQVAALCGAEGVVNPDVAAQAGDLLVEGTYPVTEAQWADGERTFYCFVTRQAGAKLTGDARGPAAQG